MDNGLSIFRKSILHIAKRRFWHEETSLNLMESAADRKILKLLSIISILKLFRFLGFYRPNECLEHNMANRSKVETPMDFVSFVFAIP